MFEQIWDLIKKNDSIVIYGHINPDGDCYGSQVGLKEIILANLPGKQVYITGSGVPPFFDVICKMDEVSDETIKNSLAIIVDGNDLARMEILESSPLKNLLKSTTTSILAPLKKDHLLLMSTPIVLVTLLLA